MVAVGVMIAMLLYPTYRRNLACLTIMVGLGMVMVLEFLSDYLMSNPVDTVLYELAFSSQRMLNPGYSYTIFTSIFLHGGMLHIIFNLFALFFLGTMLEERIRARKFVIIFLLSGLVGNIVYAVADFGGSTLAIGASGAISGIMGAIVILFPNERVNAVIYFIPLRNIPVWVMGLLFIAIQFVFVMNPGSGIAWQAHIGGLLGGMAIARPIARMGFDSLPSRTPVIDIMSLARTPHEKEIVVKIANESIPTVRNAWIEELAKTALCPICGDQMRAQGGQLKCRSGHRFRMGR